MPIRVPEMTRADIHNKRQKRGRDAEWEAIKPFLAHRAPGKFIDVGCGTGYAMVKARELDFDVAGIDPESSTHGVRDEATSSVAKHIITAAAEKIPFPDEHFDVVYSSNAIEHFADLNAGLNEMRRVLKADGCAVLVIPTGTMAALLVVTMWIFYTHRSIGKFLLRTRSMLGFMRIFLGEPHGTESRYAVQEIRTFSIKRWRTLIGNYFIIDDELRPCLYPWPNYPPLFPMMRLKRFSSSVAFICRKRAGIPFIG